MANFVTCKDGFQWIVIDAKEAKNIFIFDNKEVFVLDDNNDEHLIEDIAEFEKQNLRFAVEMDFAKV